MNQDDDLLNENSIGDLLDEDTDLPADESEPEKSIDLTPDSEEKETDEEEILGAETEFGEDPDYDDSVDDFDTDEGDYLV